MLIKWNIKRSSFVAVWKWCEFRNSGHTWNKTSNYIYIYILLTLYCKYHFMAVLVFGSTEHLKLHKKLRWWTNGGFVSCYCLLHWSTLNTSKQKQLDPPRVNCTSCVFDILNYCKDSCYVSPSSDAADQTYTFHKHAGDVWGPRSSRYSPITRIRKHLKNTHILWNQILIHWERN